MIRRKILIILPWNQQGPTGIENIMTIVTNHLSEKYNFYIIAISNIFIEKPSELKSSTEFYSLVKSRARKTIFPLRCYIKNINPDIIIANGPHLSVLAWVVKKISFSSAFLVSINHGVDKENRLSLFYCYFSCLLSNKNIAVSRGIKKYLQQIKCPHSKKINVIYNGLDIGKIKSLSEEKISKEEFCWNDKYPTIIGVGRLTQQKSFDVLIRAFAQIIHKHKKHINLLLVGDGELRSNLENLVYKLNIKKFVYFLGWQDNPFKFMKNSDVFVLSSKYEGLPTVLIEAMACGTPVVSTDCPSGPSEILENGKYGKLVPVGDINALSKAIEETLENPIKKQLQERAHYFSEEKNIKKYKKFLSKI